MKNVKDTRRRQRDESGVTVKITPRSCIRIRTQMKLLRYHAANSKPNV